MFDITQDDLYLDDDYMIEAVKKKVEKEDIIIEKSSRYPNVLIIKRRNFLNANKRSFQLLQS